MGLYRLYFSLHAKSNVCLVPPCHPLRAKFSRGNKNIYLHFMSFLRIDMAQVVEILAQVGQEHTCIKCVPGAHPTNDISIEFEIRPKVGVF